MADADEATNELIARLLAGDNDQLEYDVYGDGEVSDDSDYGQPTKRRPKRGKATAKAPSSKAVAQSRGEKRKPQSCGVPEADEFTASGRRKRKDTGAKREGAAKGWTEEEERLFLEGLELYGREWHKAAAHVGTRDKKAFTSHAQKHFIKLCIADKLLPQKVVDTGAGNGLGYTLSGLPLDPNSASAKSYGFKPEHLKRLMASGGPAVKGLLVPEKENQSGPEEANGAAIEAKKEKDAPEGKCTELKICTRIDPLGLEKASMPPQSSAFGSRPRAFSAGGKSRDAAGVKAAVTLKSDVPAKEPQRPKKAETHKPQQPEAPPEPTEYMRNRPRREGAGMRSRLGDTSESLELVSCSEFVGPPGSGASLAQPFEVSVDAQVNLVMDFHAHLCACEIIGLLGGTWDAEKRRIAVKAAYPCSRLEGSHSSTSVEVDPEAQVRAIQQMEQRGQMSVGWYHSHPIFAPTPSQKDNENQRNQQAVHRCAKTALEPCLGAIVGPYDLSNPSEASVMTWFVVQSRGSQLVPYNVRLSSSPAPVALPDSSLETALKNLVDSTADDPDRVEFTKEWRPFRLLVDGQPQGVRLTNLSKMRLAVARHLSGQGTDPEVAATFLDSLFGHLKRAWGVSQAPPERQEERPEVEEVTAVGKIKDSAEAATKCNEAALEAS